jgi:hypothetical protein
MRLFVSVVSSAIALALAPAGATVSGAATLELAMGLFSNILPETCIVGTDLDGKTLFDGVDAAATAQAAAACASGAADRTGDFAHTSKLAGGECVVTATASFVCQ